MPISTSRNSAERPNPRAHDVAQSLAWLKQSQNDYWYRSQMPFNDFTLSLAIGRNKRYIRNAFNGAQMLTRVMGNVSRSISDIENFRLVFPRPHNGRPRKDTPRAPHFIRIPDPPPSISIAKISAREAWTLWARCSTCSGNKFLPIQIDGKRHVACYHCFPPSQYGQIGAREVKKSLIHEALKAFY